MEIEVTKENFEKEVLQSTGLVIVDFWAPWCGPCKMLAPVLKELADENPDIKVCKVNVDEQEALSVENEIMSIPTLHAYKNGKKIAVSSGYLPKDLILRLLEEE